MVWVPERKAKAYDEKGNEVDCDLVRYNKNQANPDGFKGTKETSSEAKAKIDIKGISKSQRELIYQVIKENNGACLREISDLSGLQKSSVSARVNELAKENRVYDSGRKHYKEMEVIVWKTN